MNTLSLNKIKRLLRYFWLFLIVLAIGSYLYSPDSFTGENITLFIKNKNANLFLVYVVISLIRGLFLLPSTPFVLAGVILFPTNLSLVFVVSMLGILTTAVFLYYASRFLEFNKLFGDSSLNRPSSASGLSKVEKISQKINKYGFWIVLGWAFFPLVPTDLICYVAGTTKMNFKKYISAIFIGEAILVFLYLYLGESVWKVIL